MFAASSGNLEVVRRLLAAGAQPRAADNSGDTAEQYALRNTEKPNQQAILTLLKQSGAQQAYVPGVPPAYLP